ncbi:MAG: hypothetical protein ACR2QM_10395, partial [Longimicrobiales bacterium]
DPTPALVYWRWTVCVALHMGCSLVAGLGLMRIWSRTVATLIRPDLARGAPLMASAIVIHGAYNTMAVAMESLLFQF